MIIDMKEISGSSILSGSMQGRSVYANLITKTSTEPSAPEVVYLNFSKVSVATASFLRESVIAFRDSIRGRGSTYYPVIANVNDAVKEEFLELLRGRGKALMICSLSENSEPSNAALIGELDPKQGLTYKLVHEKGETDAAELRDQDKDGAPTVWNNRLSALVDLGLIIELREGRSKKYKTLFEKGVYHGV